MHFHSSQVITVKDFHAMTISVSVTVMGISLSKCVTSMARLAEQGYGFVSTLKSYFKIFKCLVNCKRGIP